MPDEPPRLAVYSLTVLSRLLSRCGTLPEVLQAVAAYPEDAHREGNVRDDMRQFVLRFSAYAPLVEAVRARVAEQGGPAALDALQDRMEFDEFMSGWDQDKT